MSVAERGTENTTDALNLGAGMLPLPGLLNIDLCYDAVPYAQRREWLDAGSRTCASDIYPLDAIPDETVSFLRASHCLEHFPRAQTMDVLREWIRVLKPGGILKIAVPNFRWIAEKYLSNPDATDWPIAGYVMGGQTDERDFHKAIFDEDGLTEALEGLGLVDIQPWTSEVQDCAALPVSLNLQGRKKGTCAECGRDESQCFVNDCLRTHGGAAISQNTRAVSEAHLKAASAFSSPPPSAPIEIPPGAVKAVMTMPRLAFTDNLFCCMKALTPLGIQLERTGGVFWCQGMTNAMEPHLSDGTRYLLSLDYDSVFEKGDVLELVRILETRPEIDAVCAVQMRREEDSPLFCAGEFPDGPKRSGPREIRIERSVLAADTMPIVTGHFGLTLLRVSSLAKLPRPWFNAQPDSSGSWGEGRCDADIFYWKQWREAGLTLHLANRVVIGHLQLMVSWPGQDLRLTNQFVSHYHRDGKPKDAWS